MTTYNTGNPIGSTDARDRLDNSENMDILENSTTLNEHPDRLGTMRKTRKGMELEHDNQISAHEVEHDNQMQSFESDFDGRLAGMAFTRVGTFTTGATLTDMRQTLLWEISQGGDGREYGWTGAFQKVVPPASTPAGTGGVGAGAWVDRTDVTLRDEISPISNMITNVSSFAVGVGTETTEFNSAVSKALLGDRTLHSDVDISVNGNLASNQMTEIKIEGIKSITGPYRKKVVDEFRSAFVPVNTINPDVHLKALHATSSPIVVMMGDSISTEGPNSITLANSMWSCIKERLIKSNPSKAFTFYNRGIGGQTWLRANGIPTAFPYWYTITTDPWLDYVKALSPDVLFLAFGMNDANGFNSGAVIAVVNKIKAWTKVPDIIFVTNPVPAQTTVYPDGSGFGFVGQTFQEGRDYAAGWVRDYANLYGYGVVDINRTFVAMRDCYDVTSGVLEKSAEVAASYYTATKSSRDFSFRCIADGSLWPEGKVLSVKSGLGANDFIFVKKTSGNFVVEGFTSSLNTYKSASTGIAVPAGQFGFELSVTGGICRLIVDPNGIDFTDKRVICEIRVVRHGGIFLPIISWQGENDGPFTSIVHSSGYPSATYEQTVTDTDIWGASDLTAATKEPFGGNGINHYSSKGIQFVVRPTIEACNLSSSEDLSGEHAGGRWTKFADGTSVYSKTVSWSGDASTAFGNVFTSADIADTDFPSGVFVSDGASGYKFSQSLHINSPYGGLWIGSSSELRNAIRYNIFSAKSRTGITATIHITMTGRWK